MPDKKKRFKLFGARVSTKDLSIFTRQFAVMINAGLPIVQCLEILEKQAPSPFFKETLGDVVRSVETGATLTESLARHKKAFDTLYVSMVKAGESSGALNLTLERIADYLEKANALKAKIKGAMAYPAVIFIVSVGVAIFMLVSIVPTFAKMFEGMGGELPGMTRAVMNLSDFIIGNFVYIFIVIGGLIFGIRQYGKTRKGRLKIDTFILKLPIFGTLIRKTAVARFARTLSTLTESGVPILSGLEITAQTSGNKLIENAILKSRISISEGKPIAEPLEESGVFPSMVTSLIRVGEESGKIASMLTKIADFYDDEVDTAVAALTSIIEPITIVFMGGIVGTLMIAMYMPMFDIAGMVK